jgi:hypothetical protein
MTSFQEGYEQGKIIGNILTLGFRIMWFFMRIAWWLAIFLIASMAAGVAALAKLGRQKPDENAGFGRYSADGDQWQDSKTSEWYPVRLGEQETCEVHAIRGGFHWQRNALSRLVRRGAIVRYRFTAVSGAADLQPRAIASEEFLNEARHNITLDHLDPAEASSDPYGLSDNRDEAVSALDHLDWILTNQGWEKSRELAGHWYAGIYTRPTILWDQPVVSAADSES